MDLSLDMGGRVTYDRVHRALKRIVSYHLPSQSPQAESALSTGFPKPISLSQLVLPSSR